MRVLPFYLIRKVVALPIQPNHHINNFLLIIPDILILNSPLHLSYYIKGLLIIELYWSVILQHPLLTLRY
jgi:hypothetical protein